MDTQPKDILKLLRLLLRCGMVCREELNMVLEMMPAVPNGGLGDREERAGTVTPCGDTEPRGETVAPQSRQKTLTLVGLEFDRRA